MKTSLLCSQGDCFVIYGLGINIIFFPDAAANLPHLASLRVGTISIWTYQTFKCLSKSVELNLEAYSACMWSDSIMC